MEIINIINIFNIPDVDLKIKYDLKIHYEIIFGGMDFNIFKKKFPLLGGEEKRMY